MGAFFTLLTLVVVSVTADFINMTAVRCMMNSKTSGL